MQTENIQLKKIKCSERVYCAIPLRLDCYSHCSLNCVYCYSKFAGSVMRKKNNDTNKISIKNQLLGKTNESLEFIEEMKNNNPIQVGVTTDPFQNEELKDNQTMRALYYLMKYKKKVFINTKGKALLDESYYNFISKNKDNIVLRISFSTFNKELSAKLEPNAATVEERKEIIKKFAKVGIKIIIRLEPFIFDYSFLDLENSLSELKNYAVRLVTDALIVSECAPNVNKNLFKILQTTKSDFFKNKQGTGTRSKFGKLHIYDYDPFFLQAQFKKLKAIVNKNNMLFGIGGYFGIEHTNLIDGNYCCEVNDWNYNKYNFVSLTKNNPDEFEKIGKINIEEFYQNKNKDIEKKMNLYAMRMNKDYIRF